MLVGERQLARDGQRRVEACYAWLDARGQLRTGHLVSRPSSDLGLIQQQLLDEHANIAALLYLVALGALAITVVVIGNLLARVRVSGVLRSGGE